MTDVPLGHPTCSYEHCTQRVFTNCGQCGKPYCSNHVRLSAPRRYLCSTCLGEPASVQAAAGESASAILVDSSARSRAEFAVLGFLVGCLPLGTPTVIGLLVVIAGKRVDLDVIASWLPVALGLYVLLWLVAIIVWLIPGQIGRPLSKRSRSLVKGLMLGLGVSVLLVPCDFCSLDVIAFGSL